MLTASRRLVLAALATGALAAGAAFGGGAAAAAPTDAYGFQGEGGLLKKDVDRRAGAVTPSVRRS